MAFGRLRFHAARSSFRLGALVVADVALLHGVQQLVRLFRDSAPIVTSLLPTGAYGGNRLVVAVLTGMAIVGAYRTGDRWRSWSRVSRGVALGVALALWDDLWLTPGVVLARWTFAVLLLSMTLAIGRGILATIVSRWRVPAERRESVILVGAPGAVDMVAHSQIFAPGAPFAIQDRLTWEEGHDPQRFGELVLATVRRGRASTIVVSGQVPGEVWQGLLELADVGGWRVLSMTRQSGSIVTSIRQTSYLGIPVTEVTTPHLRFHQLVLKRTFDLLGSAIGLLTCAPLLFALGVAVRVTSSGPALFAQTRVGLGGRTFKMYKFRSMVSDAEERLPDLQERSLYKDARLFKIPDDPRVTRLGRLLRRSSLDELPQLLNVLTGEMSFVGPRPPVPREVNLYEGHHYCRFEAKPGITGPWQVAGRNEVTDFDEVVLLEREYIRNWSLGRDLRILFQTIMVVATGRGAV